MSEIGSYINFQTSSSFTKYTFDIILANPPFIPTPAQEDIEKRYGLFSSGGSDGEDVLRSIISLSPKLLRRGSGLLAIVSEFMNPPQKEGEGNGSLDLELLVKIQTWWRYLSTQHQGKEMRYYGAKGVLFTNEYPVTASMYASRRADNESEFNTWLQHLESCAIHSVSPGLLFMRSVAEDRDQKDFMNSIQVPKSKFGSIWTPYNIQAVQYIKRVWKDMVE